METGTYSLVFMLPLPNLGCDILNHESALGRGKDGQRFEKRFAEQMRRAEGGLAGDSQGMKDFEGNNIDCDLRI